MEMIIFKMQPFAGNEEDDREPLVLSGLSPEEFNRLAEVIDDTARYDWR